VSETKADPAAVVDSAEIEEPDPRLMAGESVVFKTDKHWFAPVADSGIAILAIIAALVLVWLQTDQTSGIIGFGNRVLNLIAIALFLFGVGSIIYNIIAWRSAKYLVTNFRVLGDEGLLRKRSTDTLLSSISDVRFRQSAIGKSLGFGDVQILSASGEAGADKFTTVVKADVLKKTILEQKIAIDSPAPAPATAGAPAAAPAAAPSGQSETMATLTQLAALRDSGAITAEEYETKKQQLLSRL
jgi:uncharacterized membrane protein YdbT with pleckstrin-like domain